MTHQTRSLGKYWKLFRATLKSKPIRGQISTIRASGSPFILEYFSLPVHHSVSQSFRQSLSMSIHCLSVSPSVRRYVYPWVHLSVSLSVLQSVSPSVRQYVCVWVHLSVSQPVSLSVSQSICQYVHLFPRKEKVLGMRLAVRQSVGQSVSQSVYLPVHLSVCLSARPPVCPLVCLWVCPSASQSVSQSRLKQLYRL